MDVFVPDPTLWVIVVRRERLVHVDRPRDARFALPGESRRDVERRSTFIPLSEGRRLFIQSSELGWKR
jgi:hypothetical protein